MARYIAAIESPTAVPTSAPSGAVPGMLWGHVLGNSSTGGIAKIRRLTLGVRAGTGAPTSQQVTVGLIRTTARGTQTTTVAWQGLEGYTAVTPVASPGVDTAWTTPPTPLGGSWVAPWFYEVSFNTQAAVDLPFELLEELMIQPGGSSSTYLGLALVNIGNALPTAHLYTASVEVEF